MLQAKPLAQRQEEEEEMLQAKPLAQRQEEEELQMKPVAQRQVGLEGGDVDPQVEQSIQQKQGGGQALPNSLRTSMEGAFGADFSGVRVHNDTEADSLNDSMQARAFTTGQDIYLRKGEYKPGSSTGQELLAHELTHVVQQNPVAIERDSTLRRSNGDTPILGRRNRNKPEDKSRAKEAGQEEKLEKSKLVQRAPGPNDPAGPAWEAAKQVAPNFVLDKPAPKRSNTDASTTTGADPTFTGHPAVDRDAGVWRYQLDTAEAKGKIQIVYYTFGHYPAPAPTDDSGALHNVSKDNWQDIVDDLESNKAGIADFWSAYRAEDVHEDYHWRVEWQGEVKSELAKAETAIASLQVGFDETASVGEAYTQLKPDATQILDDAMTQARDSWNAMGDSAGDPPYQVQIPVVEALIQRVKDYAKDQGWS